MGNMATTLPLPKKLGALISGVLFLGFFLFALLLRTPVVSAEPPNFNSVVNRTKELGFKRPQDSCYVGATYGSNPAAYCNTDFMPNEGIFTYLNEFAVCRSGDTDLVGFIDRLNNARDSGVGGYAITSIEGINDGSGAGEGGEVRGIQIIVWEDQKTLQWEYNAANDYSYVGITGERWLLSMRPAAQSGNPTCQPFFNHTLSYVNNSSVSPIAMDRVWNTFPIANTLPPSYGGVTTSYYKLADIKGQFIENYPEGYTGNPLYTEYYDIPDNTAEFDVFISGYNISTEYKGNVYDDVNCTILQWSVTHTEGEFEGKVAITDITGNIDVTVNQTGLFKVSLVWTWDEAKCGAFTEQIVLATHKIIPIDGVSNWVADYNDERQCVVDDLGDHLCIYTAIIPELNDCSVYGATEIGDRLGCEIDNFIIKIKRMMFKYFIPQPVFLQEKMIHFQAQLEKNDSFLLYPMVWFGETLTYVTTIDPSCTLQVNNFFGSSAEWNLCTVETTMPQAWELGTTLLRVTVVLGFIFTIFAAFRNLWSTKE